MSEIIDRIWKRLLQHILHLKKALESSIYLLVTNMSDIRALQDAGKYALELLSFTSAAADAFPPLKSAAGSALYIAQAVKVRLLTLFNIYEHYDPPPELELQVKQGRLD